MRHQSIMRARGIIGSIAADGRRSGSAEAVIAELTQAFATFRQTHDERLRQLEDAQSAQMETINALRIGGDSVQAGPARGRLGNDARAALMNIMAGGPQAGMRVGSNPDGGFTVPDEVDNVIGAMLRSISPMRNLARVVTLGEGVGTWKKVVQRTGAQTRWAGEEDDRAETDTPTLGTVEYTPQEIYAIPEVTNYVLEDSQFNLEQFLADDVASEIALGEGAAFIAGDGLKKPRGFLSNTITNEADADRAFGTLQYVATGAAGAFASSNPVDNLFDLVTALARPYRAGQGVAWMMNSTTANVVRKFKDGDGRLMWVDGLKEGEPSRLLGYRVEIDEGMPDIGANSYSVAFGNWGRGYAIIDKVGMRLIRDPYTKKGWTKFYFSKRVAGGTVDTNAIKLLKFAAS